MARVYIALGSNIDPKKFFVNQAIKKIAEEKNTTLRKCSSFYDTHPVGDVGENRFINSVLELETALKPRELFLRLMKIERALGRTRDGKSSPRTIDLDLLLYDDLIVREKNLTIPHPRMHRRDFVMFGMNEIAPTVTHPLLKMKMTDIHARRKMKIIKSPKEAYNYISRLKKEGRRIGFVPTMGYLHEGHLSLIKKARRTNDIVCISIFINPTQFGEGEDYKRYPRDLKRDKFLAKKAGCDVTFYPDAKNMYSSTHSTYVDVRDIQDKLCGRFRKGHFRGVTTVVAKLFNIIPADNAYFGQKDAQQAFIIKKMTEDLNIPVKINMLPTVREKDGLAMSSRNTYLDKKERHEAVILFESLLLAKRLIRKGERSASHIIRRMKSLIREKSSARIEYVSIVDTEDFKNIKTLKGKVLIALAVYFGRTRLIDNIIVNVKGR